MRNTKRTREEKLIPKGYSLANKHKKDDEVGIFPSEFADFEVNDLPLSGGKIQHYYWAEEYEPNKWSATTFDKVGGHGGYQFSGDRNVAVKHLVCLAKADAVGDKYGADESRKTLEYCKKKLLR